MKNPNKKPLFQSFLYYIDNNEKYYNENEKYVEDMVNNPKHFYSKINEKNNKIIYSVKEYLHKEISVLTPKSSKNITLSKSFLFSLFTHIEDIITPLDQNNYFDNEFFEFLQQYLLKYDGSDILFFGQDIISYVIEIIRQRIYFINTLNYIESIYTDIFKDLNEKYRAIYEIEKSINERKEEYLDKLNINRINFLKSNELLCSEHEYYSEDITPNSSEEDDIEMYKSPIQSVLYIIIL